MNLFGSLDKKTWVKLSGINPGELLFTSNPKQGAMNETYKYYKLMAKKKRKGVKY